MRRGWLWCGVLVACGAPRPTTGSGALDDRLGEDAPRSRAALVRELEADVLDAYARDDAGSPRGRTVDPAVGGARLGVGPGDLAVGAEAEDGRSRWPLRLGPGVDAQAWSKRLEVHVAQDGSAGWVADELSWRLRACGKTAVIPLRYTALFAREGDRWIPVVEHLSIARGPGTLDAPAESAPLTAARGARDLALALDAAGAPVLEPARPIAATIGVDALGLRPDAWAELRGEAMRVSPLLPFSVELVSRRVAGLAPRGRTPTVAYWIGLGRGPQGEAVRSTLVFERVDRWRVVQAHVALPIDDEHLARSVFGQALVGVAPLVVDCERLLGAGR